MDLGRGGQRQGEGAAAGEQIGDVAGAAETVSDTAETSACFALFGGLQEGAGRRRHAGGAEAAAPAGGAGRSTSPSQVSRARPMAFGQLRRGRRAAAASSGLPPVTATSGPASDRVTRQRQFALARGAERGQRLQRREGGDQVGVQKLAVGHRDQRAPRRGRESRPARPSWSAARPALARRRERGGEVTIGPQRRLQPLRGQRLCGRPPAFQPATKSSAACCSAQPPQLR